MDYEEEAAQIVAAWTHSDDPSDREVARRKIRALDDVGFLEPTRAMLSATEHEGERRTLYWMLGVLLRRTGDPSVGEFLMEQAGKERRKTTRMEVLRKIGEARGRGVRIADASPAIDCLSEKMRNLRLAGVGALGCSSDPRAQDALLRFIEDWLARPKESGWYAYEALRSLSEIATTKALPLIVRVIEGIDGLRVGTRKRDIKALAVKTLASIGGQSERPLLRELLAEDKAALVKWHAMRAFSRLATPEDAAAIVKRIRSILRAPRPAAHDLPNGSKPDVGHVLFHTAEGEDAASTELLWGLKALTRIGQLDDKKLLDVLRTKWDTLTRAEQALLEPVMNEQSHKTD